MKLQKLASDTAVYGLSVILGRLLNYLLVPLYTSFLEADEFGDFISFYAWAPLVFIVFTYGMETTYFRFATKDGTDEKVVFNTISTLLLITTLALTLLTLPFLLEKGQMLGFAPTRLSAWLFTGIMAVDTLSVLYLARLRQRGKAFLFSVIRLITIALTILLNIFFIVWLPKWLPESSLSGLREEAIFVSNLVANALQWVVLIWFAKPFKFQLNSVLLKQVLPYGLPILVMGIPGVVNSNFSRMMLDTLLPENFYPGFSPRDILGFYGGAYSLSVIMLLLVNAYRYAADPFFFSNTKHTEFKNYLVKALNAFVMVGGGVFLIVTLNLHFADVFLRGENFLFALEAVPILLMANLVMGIYFNISIWFKVTDRTRFALIFTLSGALANIALNIWLIPEIGFMGAAWATLASYSLMALLCYLSGRKYFPVPYDLGRMVIYLVLSVVVYGLVANFAAGFWKYFWGFMAPILYIGFILIREKTIINWLKTLKSGAKSNK